MAGSSRLPSPVWWAASLFLLGCAWLLSGRVAPGPTPLAFAVWAYASWTFVHTAFFASYYHPNGLFDPAFLVAGFSLGRAFDRSDAKRAGELLLAGMAVLAVWGIVQFGFGARGRAVFETPAAFASAINLALAFTTVLVLLGARYPGLNWLVVLLVAGLGSTLSTGGAIALVVGLMITWALMRFPRLNKQDIANVARLYFAGGVCALSIFAVRIVLADSAMPESAPPGSSLAARLELYQLAWSALSTPLCCGIGYLGFRWILERGREFVPSYSDQAFTHFVHNDYLQSLLELGVPGLASLVAMVALPSIVARRHMAVSTEDKRMILAIVAALATMAIHAIGDFPFHLSAVLLLFGLFAGRLDRLCALHSELAPRWRSALGRIGMIVVGAGLITLFARPVIATLASVYGTYHSALGDGPPAAFGFELARRFDSRDWRFHFQAGQFWFAQAAQSGEADAAQRAEAAFVAGIAANPFEPSTRLGRVTTHIRFAPLLQAPADSATLRVWLDEALSLAPRSPTIRREHAELMRLIDAQR